jgi:hypothetical protein
VTSNTVRVKSLSYKHKLQELQRLKQSVEDGTYAVPPEKVAASIIEHMLSAAALNKVRHENVSGDYPWQQTVGIMRFIDVACRAK